MLSHDAAAVNEAPVLGAQLDLYSKSAFSFVASSCSSFIYALSWNVVFLLCATVFNSSIGISNSFSKHTVCTALCASAMTKQRALKAVASLSDTLGRRPSAKPHTPPL